MESVVYQSVSGRIGFLYLERATLELVNGVPVAISKGVVEGDTQEFPIPSGRLACLMLGPGTRITHAVVDHLTRQGCLLLWTGEQGVRVYSAGHPGGAHGDRLLRQAAVILDDSARLEAARRLYRLMLCADAPRGRSIEQLRGFEGSWVRAEYARLAHVHGVPWHGRNQENGDTANRAISMATSTLYGVTEAAILALGLSPALGIVHRGDSRSLVFDIADTVKFRTVVPLAFEMAAAGAEDIQGRTRRACRDLFVRNDILEKLVAIAEHVVMGHGLDGFTLTES